MNAPIKVRERWIVFIDGKKKKFNTEDAAWEALGGRPKEENQLELEWEELLEEQLEKSSKRGVIGSFFSSDDNSNS